MYTSDVLEATLVQETVGSPAWVALYMVKCCIILEPARNLGG